MRGLSYDVHRLVRGSELALGGLKLPIPWRAVAHSDGDVLLHSLIDATLGALGFQGDIGTLFPEVQEWKGADSKEMFKLIRKRFCFKYWKISVMLISELEEVRAYSGDILAALSELTEAEGVTLTVFHDIDVKGLPPAKGTLQAFTLVELDGAQQRFVRLELREVLTYEELRSLFPELSVKYHPYSSESSEERAQELIEAIASILRGEDGSTFDLTVIAQTPKLSPLRREILWRLRELTGYERLSLKFRSTEGMGEIGEGKGAMILALPRLDP